MVQLNGSDDSDSDMEACSSSTQTQPVFGGLEFMIKEARRNAEVRTCVCPNSLASEDDLSIYI